MKELYDPKNLNICLVNDSFPPTIDGVANTVVNYATSITKFGGKAAVATPAYPGADDSAFPFPVYRYPSVDMTKISGYRAGVPISPELYVQLHNHKFQLVHTHCPVASTFLARSMRDLMQIPVVFTYHTKFDVDIAETFRAPFLREEAIRLLVGNIAACDEVWTVSRGAGENLRSLGYEGDYIVMPNGVDMPLGKATEEKIHEACKDYDLPEGVPLFLFVGRMRWYKGIRIILDALSGLKSIGTDFRMVFVGGGMDLHEIREYAAHLRLGDKVFFVPPVHDRELIRVWYTRADLFLFPSTFDTNGLVVREAAACALPSVLVRGSCAAEDTADGQNAFWIEENSASMALMLYKLCENMPAVHEAGERAQKELYLSWDDAVKRACDRYPAVIEKFRTIARKPPMDIPEDVARIFGQVRSVIKEQTEWLFW